MKEQAGILIQQDQESGPKTRWSFLFKLTVGAGLLALVIWFVDFQELINVAVSANPWLLLAVAVLIYLDRGLMAYKWRPLLQSAGVHVPFPLLVRTYFVAQLAGMFLPSTVGGDVFKVYALSRHKFSAQGVLASIVAERVIGFVGMLALVTLSLGLAFYLMRDSWVYLRQVALLLLVAVGVGVILVGVALGGIHQLLARLAGRFARFPGVSKLFQIYTIYAEYRNQRLILARVMCWTLLEQTLPIFTNYILILAFHIDVSLIEVAAIVPLIILGMRLPISMDGLGVQEGLFVALFSLVGVSVAEALLLSTTARLLTALCALPWGIHYLFERRQPVRP